MKRFLSLFMLLNVVSITNAQLFPFFDEFEGDVLQPDREPSAWTEGPNGTTVSPFGVTSENSDLIIQNHGGYLGAFVYDTSVTNPDGIMVEDVSLRTQLRFLQSGIGTSFAAIAARGNTGEIYWGGPELGGNFLVGTADNVRGVVTLASIPFPDGLDVTEEDVILQLDVFGDQIDFSAYQLGNEMPIATFSSPSRSALSAERKATIGDRGERSAELEEGGGMIGPLN